eukprot:TRINITY_DN14771_c0_g1_i1.p1 TRINITY_DN14771_c0_g1~~TRINITY_DN14771_c0_g1_i1.p1  ORF type:complete len:427 (+),score=103.91 TRINITY_DN14771_c0_g1_i1:272-1552(+)
MTFVGATVCLKQLRPGFGHTTMTTVDEQQFRKKAAVADDVHWSSTSTVASSSSSSSTSPAAPLQIVSSGFGDDESAAVAPPSSPKGGRRNSRMLWRKAARGALQMKQAYGDKAPDVLFQAEGALGLVTLGRPSIEAVADDCTRTLGVVFKGMPPGDVRVLFVVQGSWAYKQGIQVASELLEIAGRRVQDIADSTFQKLMKQRPLKMLLQPPRQLPPLLPMPVVAEGQLQPRAPEGSMAFGGSSSSRSWPTPLSDSKTEVPTQFADSASRASRTSTCQTCDPDELAKKLDTAANRDLAMGKRRAARRTLQDKNAFWDPGKKDELRAGGYYSIVDANHNGSLEQEQNCPGWQVEDAKVRIPPPCRPLLREARPSVNSFATFEELRNAIKDRRRRRAREKVAKAAVLRNFSATDEKPAPTSPPSDACPA